MSEIVKQQSRLKDLIARGKEQGYLTYTEVNDHLPEDISEGDLLAFLGVGAYDESMAYEFAG